MAQSSPISGRSLIEKPEAVEASNWRRLRFENEQACRAQLFQFHLPTARAIARNEFNRRPSYGLDRGEFDQLAFAGLLEAIDRFDPLFGVKFPSYAGPRIRGSISDGLQTSSEDSAGFTFRQRVERERVSSLMDTMADDTGSPLEQLSDLVVGLAIGMLAEPDYSDSYSGIGEPSFGTLEWRELVVSIRQGISRLSDNESFVLEQHYFHNVSFRTIAGLMKVSAGRVSQIHREALARLREQLGTFD